MKTTRLHSFVLTVLLLLASPLPTQAAVADPVVSSPSPEKLATYAKIIRHEDERVLDKELLDLLEQSDDLEQLRRVIMAVGRIGDPNGVAPLVAILQNPEDDALTKSTAAFALGEIESADALPALLEVLKSSACDLELRSRSAEALGKILANKESSKSLSKDRISEISRQVVSFLEIGSAAIRLHGWEEGEYSRAKDSLGKYKKAKSAVGLALTALLRIKDPAALESIIKELDSPDSESRWRAAYVLARLKDGISPAVPALQKLLNDKDDIVAAQAAKAIGVAKDKSSVEHLCQLLKQRPYNFSWSVISAVSALGSIADMKAVPPLLELGKNLFETLKNSNRQSNGIPSEQNLLLLTATALGEIKDEQALPFLKELREEFEKHVAQPELEIALAKFGESAFFDGVQLSSENWQSVSAHAQGLGELKSKRAAEELAKMLASKPDPRAVSEILNAMSASKVENLQKILLAQLQTDDVIVRSTAASLLADQGDSSKLVSDALSKALESARKDKMNDARISIVEAAAKLKFPLYREVLTGTTRDSDYIVRRRAIELMKEAGESTSEARLGPVNTGHDQAYWDKMAQMVLSGQKTQAVIKTKKGQITIELFAKDSPMMVDSFMELSKSGFYDGLTFMRVVPNFVIQGGDPRNDMNGGPGYQVRDEINMHPYTYITVGIALSGKDTGGSQFFITLMPQPHLDGGYTVIGQVPFGLSTLSLYSIARGEAIEHIEIK